MNKAVVFDCSFCHGAKELRIKYELRQEGKLQKYGIWIRGNILEWSGSTLTRDGQMEYVGMKKWLLIIGPMIAYRYHV